MDNNTTVVLILALITSIFWLPIAIAGIGGLIETLLAGIASIVRAWKSKEADNG